VRERGGEDENSNDNENETKTTTTTTTTTMRERDENTKSDELERLRFSGQLVRQAQVTLLRIM
jgi:hypothetical protein